MKVWISKDYNTSTQYCLWVQEPTVTNVGRNKFYSSTGEGKFLSKGMTENLFGGVPRLNQCRCYEITAKEIK